MRRQWNASQPRSKDWSLRESNLVPQMRCRRIGQQRPSATPQTMAGNPMTHEALHPAINRLADACADLAQPQRHTIRTDHGRRRVHLPPRYTQLHQSIGAARAGSHTSEFGSRSPCSSAALDLLHEIDKTVALMHPAPRGWHGWTIMRLHALPQQPWRPQDTRQIHQMANILERYTQSIDQLFDPPAVIHLNKPCPACDNVTFSRTIDGEQSRQSALLLTAAECRCQVCGTTWSRDQFEFLGRILETREITSL